MVIIIVYTLVLCYNLIHEVTATLNRIIIHWYTIEYYHKYNISIYYQDIAISTIKLISIYRHPPQ